MQVYYFSRTGRSERIAKELAQRFHTSEQRIDDKKDWSGAIRYLKAGYWAARGKALPASYSLPSSQEPIILVFPIWAGTFPPAVRTFIEEVGRDNILAIPTSLGSTLRDREGFLSVIDLVGKEISAPEIPTL